VHFDELDRLDRINARQLAGLDNVRLIPWDGGGHTLSQRFVKNGELERIVTRSLSP
jgi:hypothetical protein